MLVLVLVRWEHLNELRLFFLEQALEFAAIDRVRHQVSLKIDSKIVRPASDASGIEIGRPLISGCSRRYAVALSADSKKLRTSQQPRKLGPSQQLLPASTTAL